MADGIGLSVGAANLRAVVVDRAAVTRAAVLTLYPHRPPEVGLPSENPNLAERGLVINDFVDRVGDPVGIVAPDGSSHRADVLLADALRAMLYAVTRGQPPAGPVGVTHPAHWRPSAVDALRGALAAVPEFSAGKPAPLVSDAVAALTALQHDPGVPARGVIAVCDFGGTGTSITLADAAHGFAPLAPTVRYTDLSGDLIDQALLTHVIADLSAAGSVDLSGTSAIGSLTKLRAQCRAAKERLSTAAVTSMPAELPGSRGEVRITRNELDDAIRRPLAGFIEELQDALQRSGIQPADLVAVASVGGGARVPIITTTLSEHLRVPVVTTARPELAAAIGAGLKAVRGTVEDGATSMAVLPAPAAVVAPMTPPVASLAPGAPVVPAESLAPVALAWSDAQDVPEVVPAADGPRPHIAFEAPEDEPHQAAPVPWYRRPTAVMAAGVVVLLAAIAGAVVLLTGRVDEPTPSIITGTTAPGTPTSTAPLPSAPTTTEAVPPPAPPPVTQTHTATGRPAPPVTVTETEPPLPPPTTEPPPPPTTEPPPPTTEPPPPWSPTPPYPTIPGLPWVPLPGGQPVPAVP
ncbi:MAG: hypothetical protein QOH54_967 [Mycobacterium sp.]|nr:hypothetical protein [Mycobacterium sp.]